LKRRRSRTDLALRDQQQESPFPWADVLIAHVRRFGSGRVRGAVQSATLPIDKGDLLPRAAALLRQRNAIEIELAQLTERPMTSGHLGEWVASQIFDIELEKSAASAGIDGHFRPGAFLDRTVNIKWYLKREGLLDTTALTAPDYYLVLTGPPSAAASSRGSARPWRIDAVFLFDARQLHSEQVARGSEAGRRFQRHEAAMGGCRDLPLAY
jgi:hypothetical protein